jgi:hypothetical protein
MPSGLVSENPIFDELGEVASSPTGLLQDVTNNTDAMITNNLFI